MRLKCIFRLFVAAISLAASIHAGASAEKSVTKDIFITEAGGIEIRGDMHLPDGGGPFPGILFIHGGGFVGGSKDWAPLGSLVEYYVDNGYAVFSVDYRLLKDGGLFPNNVKDVKCGLAWMKDHAGEYKIDPSRIGAVGESAGGYLAAMIALTPNMPDFQPDCPGYETADTSVKTAVLFYAPFNFTSFKSGFFKVMEVEIKRMAGLKSKREVEEFKRKHSPINYIDSSPPLFISFASPDNTVPVSQQYEMIEALENAGRYFESYEATGPGMDHGFVLTAPDSPQAVEAKTKSLEFLEKHLRNIKNN